jgi:hypothetical protein
MKEKLKNPDYTLSIRKALVEESKTIAPIMTAAVSKRVSTNAVEDEKFSHDMWTDLYAP